MRGDFKVIQVLAPLADRFDTKVDTRVVNLGNYRNCLFLINMGVNSGVGRLKIKAWADDVLKINKEAIGYSYRSPTAAAPDTEGAWTRVEVGAEPTLAANICASNQVLVAIDPTEIAAVMEAAGHVGGAVHLEIEEAVNGAIVGCVSAILSGGVEKSNLPDAFVS